MKWSDQNDSNEIWKEFSTNWNEVSLDKFMSGLNIETEHGITHEKAYISGKDEKLTDETSWAHLQELRDYYSRLNKLI